MAAPAGTGNERTYSRPASRDDFEIAIICALTREMNAVELLVDDFWTDGDDQNKYGKLEGDTNIYEHGRIGNFNVVLVTLPEMGKGQAALAAGTLATSYPKVSLVLSVGVCGGVPFVTVGGRDEEIVLGDVIISNMLTQYDMGRQFSDDFVIRTEIEHQLGRPNRDIRGLLKNLEIRRNRNDIHKEVAHYLKKLQHNYLQDNYQELYGDSASTYVYPGAEHDKLFEDSYKHMHRGSVSDPECHSCANGSVCGSARTKSCDEIGCDRKHLAPRKRRGEPNHPRIFIGHVGSADTVMRSAQHREVHAKNGIIGFEMEAAGVWDVLPCVVIKGVSDYADSHKNKGWQDYSAATAASAVRAFLNHYYRTGRISGNAGDRQGAISVGNQIQPPFSNLPFPPDNGFVERSDIAEWLREKLEKPGSRAALYGLGGIGIVLYYHETPKNNKKPNFLVGGPGTNALVTRKSRLVIRYARTIEQTPSRPHILWVHAGTRERFIDAYREIADGLKLEGRDKPEVDILKLVCNGLRHESKEWLMIVDNADDIKIFFAAETHGQLTGNEAASSTGGKTLLSYLPRTDKGKILITTRSQQVAELLVTQFTEDLNSIRRVTAMEKDQAKQLLRKRLLDYHDDKIEEDLVNVLGCIPLAIIQAAAFIVFRARNNVYSAAEYLEQFRRSDDHNLELLDYPKIVKLGDEEASHAVLRTWTMTYEQIRQERSSAADLLSVLSFFHNQGIPEWVLREYYDDYEEYHSDRSLPRDSPNPLNKDLDVLFGYSLVTVVSFPGNQNRQQPTSRSLQMHALVQTCTRHWLRSNDVDQQWLSTVTELLYTAHPSPDHDTWAKCAEISPHVDSLLTFPGLEHLDEPLTAALVHLLKDAGKYNVDIGALGRAESLIMKALDVAEKRLCNPHSATYLVLSVLEDLTTYNHGLETRFVSAANRVCAGLINSLITASGGFGELSAYMQPSSSATVAIASNSDEHTAEHKRVLLSIQDMKSAGFDNPTVLEMGHLVRFILNAPSCRSTVPAFKVIKEITYVLELLERYQDLEIIYRALLKRQTCFTERDWDIWGLICWSDVRGPAETHNSLCDVLIQQCKYQEAEDLVRMTLESNQGIGEFGITLGELLFKQKRFDEAEKVFRKALDLRYTPDDDFEKDLTPQMYSEEGLWYNTLLGHTLAKQGKHAEAVVCFRQILEWRQQLQLLEHPVTLRNYACLAKSLECLAEYEEAEGLRKHCVDVCESKFSHDHDMLGDYLIALLENLKSQGREGEEEYQRFQDRLFELGYELISSDDDDSCEESDSGSELSPDGSQAGSEGGHSLEHHSEELQVEDRSTPVDPATMTTGVAILTHDYNTMNLTTRNDERHHQAHVGKSDKPFLVYDDSTTVGRDRQLEEFGVKMPDIEDYQAQGHEGKPLTSTTSAMKEQCMEMPTQWIQTDQGQGSQIMDEPEDMEIQVTSETLESEATKRKRADTRDSIVTGRSTSREQPSWKIMRTE